VKRKLRGRGDAGWEEKDRGKDRGMEGEEEECGRGGRRRGKGTFATS